MPKTEKRDEQITIRIPSSLRKAIEAEAERERRSIADIIVFMLEAKYGSHPGRKGPKKGTK